MCDASVHKKAVRRLLREGEDPEAVARDVFAHIFSEHGDKVHASAQQLVWAMSIFTLQAQDDNADGIREWINNVAADG